MPLQELISKWEVSRAITTHLGGNLLYKVREYPTKTLLLLSCSLQMFQWNEVPVMKTSN